MLAFVEELKAASALVSTWTSNQSVCNFITIQFEHHSIFHHMQAELTNTMEKRIPTLRDGRLEQLLTRLLVPGDVIFLMCGIEVPADVDWLEGDILSIDTAPLTGEPRSPSQIPEQ